MKCSRCGKIYKESNAAIKALYCSYTCESADQLEEVQAEFEDVDLYSDEIVTDYDNEYDL